MQASRPAMPGAFGKRTERVTTDISMDTKDELALLAKSKGIPVSSYIRDLIEAHVHGQAAVLHHHLRWIGSSEE